MTPIPKYLVECDFAAWDGAPAVPTRPLWVARTRGPFALALITATVREYESRRPRATVQLWPVIIEADPGPLIEKFARALFGHHDLDPAEWQPPERGLLPPPPPEFLHCHRPGSEAEFILDPHVPTLWRLLVERDVTTGVQWMPGWGREPEFPRDTRRVTEFIRTL